MVKRCFICHSCGEKVEFALEEPPCRVLSGWLAVSHWKGMESVDHYSFCSFGCLQRWVDTQATRIPEVFLKSIGEKDDKV
jgi:hypothetical protein